MTKTFLSFVGMLSIATVADAQTTAPSATAPSTQGVIVRGGDGMYYLAGSTGQTFTHCDGIEVWLLCDAAPTKWRKATK